MEVGYALHLVPPLSIINVIITDVKQAALNKVSDGATNHAGPDGHAYDHAIDQRCQYA
jgi:hypothetical protein